MGDKDYFTYSLGELEISVGDVNIDKKDFIKYSRLKRIKRIPTSRN